jgi:hypothetical protein
MIWLWLMLLLKGSPFPQRSAWSLRLASLAQSRSQVGPSEFFVFNALFSFRFFAN